MLVKGVMVASVAYRWNNPGKHEWNQFISNHNKAYQSANRAHNSRTYCIYEINRYNVHPTYAFALIFVPRKLELGPNHIPHRSSNVASQNPCCAAPGFTCIWLLPFSEHTVRNINYTYGFNISVLSYGCYAVRNHRRLVCLFNSWFKPATKTTLELNKSFAALVIRISEYVIFNNFTINHI